MAKHEVVIHENNGATKDVAPYTGSYIVKETVKLPVAQLSTIVCAVLASASMGSVPN